MYEDGEFWQYNHTTYKDFIRQAYDFRTSQNLSIPEFYYDILSIENPKLPDWINTPALEPIKEPSYADKIPLWIRRGQLMRESSSYYLSDGSIKYVNKKRGGNNHRKGATGPFQVLRIAWNHMRKIDPKFFKGRHYDEMQTDTKLNEEVACMYLLYIFNGRGRKNWNTTIMLYNAGPWGIIDQDAREYLRLVTKYGLKNDK